MLHQQLLVVALSILAFGKLPGQNTLYITNGIDTTGSFAISYKDSAEKLTGKVIAYYEGDTGKTAVEKYYMNGRQNGTYRAYFPGGQLMEFGVFGNGKRHGEWTWYEESGEIVTKGKYKEGIKHGYWAFLKEQCFGRYKKGKKNGKWVCYKNKMEIKYYFKNGELVENYWKTMPWK